MLITSWTSFFARHPQPTIHGKNMSLQRSDISHLYQIFRKIPISIKIQLLWYYVPILISTSWQQLILYNHIPSRSGSGIKFYTRAPQGMLSGIKCWFKKYATQLIRKQIALDITFMYRIRWESPRGFNQKEDKEHHLSSVPPCSWPDSHAQFISFPPPPFRRLRL